MNNKENSKEMGERMSYLINFLGINSAKFAENIGVKPQNIYDIRSGKSSISNRIIEKVIQKYPNVNIDWLLTGEGNILKDLANFQPGEEYKTLRLLSKKYFESDSSKEISTAALQRMEKMNEVLLDQLEKKDKLIEDLFNRLDTANKIYEKLNSAIITLKGIVDKNED